jgi:hypothetical protein
MAGLAAGLVPVEVDQKQISACTSYCYSEAAFGLFRNAQMSRYDVASSGVGMRKREFLGILGGVAAWPVVALAQQRARKARIGAPLQFRQRADEVVE